MITLSRTGAVVAIVAHDPRPADNGKVYATVRVVETGRVRVVRTCELRASGGRVEVALALKRAAMATAKDERADARRPATIDDRQSPKKG